MKNPAASPEQSTYNIEIIPDVRVAKSIRYDFEVNLKDSENKRKGWIDAQYEEDFYLNCLYVADSRSLVDKYGPLLYDVAIELATYMGYGLTSDIIVSDEATNIWLYYLKKRPDVKTFKLKENVDIEDWVYEKKVKEWENNQRKFPEFRSFKENPYLYCYQKKLNVIPRLQILNKLKIG